MPAFSHASLGVGLLGLSKQFRDENPAARVYYVFREARGVSSQNPARLNMIVRDVLWLRRAPLKTLRGTGREGISGYYFSSVDGYVYAIDAGRVVPEGYIQMFGSRLDEDGRRDDHHFFMTVNLKGGAKISGQACKSGLICGSTTNERSPAAWKLLAIADQDDRLFVEMETILRQDALLEEAKKGAYTVHSARAGEAEAFQARKLLAILAYLQHHKKLGVLSAHCLATEEASRKVLKELRRALKRILWSGREVHVDEITRQLFFDLLDAPAIEAYNELKKVASAQRAVEELITGILRSWRHLEALHIFSPARISSSSGTDNLVRKLLEAEPLFPSGGELPARREIYEQRPAR